MKLTVRDFEIIGFVLSMKFASVQNIHGKFFRKRRDGGVSESEWYTRERLRHLVELGYLNTVRYRFEQKSYYIGTKHGYDLIRFNHSDNGTVKPIESIDVRTFDHDRQVMKSRLLLEEFEKVNKWKSDRQLKCEYFEYFNHNVSRDSTPDGVYQSLGGKTIAFEHEIAQKSKQRYRLKFDRYIECFQQSNSDLRPKYDVVRIVCEKPSVYKLLVDSTAIYREYFKIEMAEDFFASFKRPEVIGGVEVSEPFSIIQ